MKEPVYKHNYDLTAGECDATGHIPVPLLVQRLIEVATEHANALGIGYAALKTQNIGWVLSRLSLEMYEYPAINDTYSLTTWIETYNRRFSERNMSIHAADGHIIGYARTIWSAIDFSTRSGADLAALDKESFPLADLPCPIAKTSRVGALAEPVSESGYVVQFCDMDFNRHMNTVRYVELILDHWNPTHYDDNCIRRLDLLFHHEVRFGEQLKLRVSENTNPSVCELTREDVRVLGASIKWEPRC